MLFSFLHQECFGCQCQDKPCLSGLKHLDVSDHVESDIHCYRVCKILKLLTVISMDPLTRPRINENLGENSLYTTRINYVDLLSRS